MSGSQRQLYHRWALGASLALAAGACAGPATSQPASGPSLPSAVALTAPVSLEEVRPFFFPGEAITWELTYKGIEGGRARLAIGEPAIVGDRSVLAIRADAESSGLLAVVKRVRDDLATWIDVQSGLPVRTESEADVSGKHIRVHTTWRAGEAFADMIVWWKRDPEKRYVRRLPTVRTHDTMSALLTIRGWEAPDGARATIYALGGQRLWRTELVVERRESVRAPLGERAAIRMSGVATRMTPALQDDRAKKPRTFTVWFSDDADRIPLRVVADTEYGEIEIAATSYERP